MTREEIKNTPELVDFMLDKSVIVDSREKLRKRLEGVCNLAIKALEQEPCVDAVSREEAIMCLTGINLPTDPDELIALYHKRLKALPPVFPKRNIVNCENFKFDEWDIGDKKAELWVIKGRLQIRHRGTIHNVDFPVLPKRECCPNCGIEMR